MVNFNQAEIEQFTDFPQQARMIISDATPKRSLLRANKLAIVLIVVGILALLTAVAIMALPFLLTQFGIAATALPPFALSFLGEGALLTAGGIALAGLIVLFVARWRVLHNQSLWAEAGCPQCHEYELVRIRRERNDRAISALGLPLRRYACRNCTWQGRRVASPERAVVPPRSLVEAYASDEGEEMAAEMARQAEDVVAAAAAQPAAEPNIIAAAPVETAVVPAPPVTAEPKKQETAEAQVKTPVADQATVQETAAASEADHRKQVIYEKSLNYHPGDEEGEFDPEFERLCYEIATKQSD